MIREQFIDYIKNNDKLNHESISTLEDLIDEFPYCQSARLLYVLNLYKEKNIHYDNQLKVTAAYVYNRKNLKKLIEKFEHPNKDENIIKEENKTDRKKLILEKVKKEYSKKDIKEQTSSKNNIDKNPLETGITEDQNSIIDKFIKDIPSIPRPSYDFYNPKRNAQDSTVDDSEIVSETLAKLYINQDDINGAIKIYNTLSLNFPDKKLYFAQQIKKLEKNTNK